MLYINRIALILCAITQIAFAGGRGGYNVIFDPNWNGGGWTCFSSAASGTCGGATAQFFNAACDGATDDTTALLAWVTYGVAQGASQAKLYVPPGSKCTFPGVSCLTTTCVSGDPVIQNALIWAYGAVANNVQFGGLDFFADQVHSAFIQSANIGDICVTLITASDSSKFAVGNWVLVDGDSLQKGGFPPNFAFFEHHQIVSINGTTTKTVCLDSPLINQYLSTWPQIDDVLTGGPAAIHLMQPSWNGLLEVHGLTVTTPNLVNVKGRTNILYDINVQQPGPSTNQSVWFFRGDLGSMEWDKNITFGEVHRSTGQIAVFQSASPATMILSSTNWRSSFSGTAKNESILNSTSGPTGLRVGPTGFGQGQSLSVTGSSFPSASSNIGRNVQLSALTYDGAGTLSILHGSGSINNAWANFIPGATFYLGASDGSDVSTPHTTFKSTTLTDDGTSLKLGIACLTNCASMPSSLPAPTCGGPTCSTFVIYSITAVKQSFNGSSPDLSQLVPP